MADRLVAPIPPRPVPPHRRLRVRQLVIVIASTGILVALALQLSTQDLKELLNQTHPAWLLAAVLCYVSMQLVRGWRLWALTRQALGLPRMIAVAAMQNMLLVILPMRTGEVSFLALLAREKQVGLPQAGKILVAVRLLDLGVITLFFIVACLLPGLVPAGVRATLPLALLLLFVTQGFVLWPRLLGRLLQVPLSWLLASAWVRRLPLAQKLQAILDQATTVSDPEGFRRLLPLLWLQSLLIWSISLLAAYLSMHAFGENLGPSEVLYLTSVLTLSGVLPIHGLGGYGAQNAFGTLLFMSLGLTWERAIGVAIGWQTIVFLAAVSGGLLGWLYLGIGQRKGAADTTN